MLFFIILFIIIWVVICNKKKDLRGEFNDLITNPELDGRIKFLLKQFTAKKLTIKEEYILSRDVKRITPENLELVLNSILEHMKLKKNVFLVYHTKDEKAYNDKAGTYDKAYLGYKAINLVLVPGYNISDYVSILAHECSHHFMDEYNFEIKDRLENERNTDTLAILLGFGKYFQKTHRERTFYKGSSFTFNGTINHYETSKLGYLSVEEINYVIYKHQEILKNGKKQKGKIKEKQEANRRVAKMEQNLNYRISQLKEEYETNIVSIEKMLNNQDINNITDRWEFKKLSQLIDKYQNGIYGPKINTLSGKLKGKKNNDEIIKELNELDEMLKMDSLFIDRYLK